MSDKSLQVLRTPTDFNHGLDGCDSSSDLHSQQTLFQAYEDCFKSNNHN